TANRMEPSSSIRSAPKLRREYGWFTGSFRKDNAPRRFFGPALPRRRHLVGTRTRGGRAAKKGGTPTSAPPFHRPVGAVLVRAPDRFYTLAQTRCVIRYSGDVRIGHAVGDIVHDFVGAIVAAEQLELRLDIAGVLAGQAGEFARNARPVGRVAACTCRHATVGDAAAPDLLAALHGGFVAGCGGRFVVQRLLAQVIGDVLD